VDHSRSLEMAPFDTSHTSFYWRSMVIITLCVAWRGKTHKILAIEKLRQSKVGCASFQRVAWSPGTKKHHDGGATNTTKAFYDRY